MGFIDTLRGQGHAVESICRVLREQGCQVAARTYRTWRQANRRIAARLMSDAAVVDALLAARVSPEGRMTPEGLYGRRKTTALLRRRGLVVAHCTVDRLMRDLAMNGVRRGKGVRTTVPGQGRETGRGSAEPGLHRGRPEHPVDSGLQLLPNLGRVRLRRVRRGRLRSTHRGLACRDEQADRPGLGPVADRGGNAAGKATRSNPTSSSTTPMPAANTPRCGSPSTSTWKTSHPRSGPSAMRTTTP